MIQPVTAQAIRMRAVISNPRSKGVGEHRTDDDGDGEGEKEVCGGILHVSARW
jgi:hypothetical protein